jgi:class 3 adenylate cyclase/tetratricopeptide (TPR) repeat protein
MVVCPSCGYEADEDFAFCPKCATALTTSPPIPEERKVVTTLICDLVGFTALSEAADTEDVDALLSEYSTRARRVIESHGGTVEKFIGDAVVGVFGVPAVHEDDPERAVRAGLRLIEALEGMKRPDGSPLQARIGVNTGEALVRLDVHPASGRGFLTGDAVNTAARLQAAAPPGGVVVGELSHTLTEKVFVYEPIEPLALKGKAAAVAAWQAKVPISRMGVEREAAPTQLVDRETELSFLEALFEKATARSSPQVVLIVGEPGIGKSRLVAELLAYVDARPDLVTWRQGRCLPYGDGVTFWALGEIVKAHAGILETDDSGTVEAKLEQVVPQVADRDWLRNRLRALLGLEAPQASREENFTAWLRFLEELAAPRAAVLVFEDLHAADEAFLAFLEHLAVHLEAVPLLIVGTARPELFEKHPAFAAAIARVNRIALERLTRAETQQLVSSLLETVAQGAEITGTIVERSEGNPFYAEESVRLVGDAVLGEASRAFDAGALLPGSVQAVIAARLDALPPEHKAMLADAAVVGTVFWSGAVAALGGWALDEVDEGMRELVARQLVRHVRDSSMARENEFAFRHGLARDVAYQQLPRTARSRKHAAVAAWIEEKAGERAEDLAEVLTHHYATALDLVRTAGDVELASSLVAPTIRSLTRAGDRALRLDVAVAERHFERALELAGADTSERLRLLPRWAKALFLRSRYREAVVAYEEAIAGLRARGEMRTAAVAMCWLSSTLAVLGEPSRDLTPAAVDLLANDGPSPEQAEVLGTYPGFLLLTEKGDQQAAIEAATRAIEVCERLALPEPAEALSWRGVARLDLGDLGGLEDYERALAAARAQGLGSDRAQIEFNYMSELFVTRGARAAYDVMSEGLEFARSHGLETWVLAYRVALVVHLRNMGEWERALAQAVDLVPALEEAEDVWDLLFLRTLQALIFACRGEPGEAGPFLAWLSEKGRASEVAWTKALALLAASAVRLGLGETDTALDLLSEWLATSRDVAAYVECAPEAVRTALNGRDDELAARVVERLESSLPERTLPLHEHVLASVGGLLGEARGEHPKAVSAFALAAKGWHDFGVPYEEAQALLGWGRCLVALGRSEEAREPLNGAREIFERLGAMPALAEVEALHG